MHAYYETQGPYGGPQGNRELLLKLPPSALPSSPTPVSLTLLLQALYICSPLHRSRLSWTPPWLMPSLD